MRRLAAILALVLGLTLLAAPPASATVTVPAENRASGSAAGLTTLIGIEAPLSEEAVRENAGLGYDIASDDAVAARGAGIVASNGTKITGLTRHGLNRAIGDGAERAGTRPQAILDALKNPKSIKEGVDSQGRPFQIFTGADARVVANPQTGNIVSTNPLSGAGAL
jgi:hypothetical protein